MANDFFSGFNDRSKHFMERASQFNETLFHQFSKAAEMQLEALRRYADIASDQARKLAEVRNLEDIKELSGAQTEAVKEISEQASSDWQAWQDYLSEARDQLKSAIMDDEDGSQSGQSATDQSWMSCIISFWNTTVPGVVARFSPTWNALRSVMLTLKRRGLRSRSSRNWWAPSIRLRPRVFLVSRKASGLVGRKFEGAKALLSWRA